MSATDPDYEGLLKLLPRLQRFPDAIGETTLTPAEAAEIRRLGFRAEPGEWKVPFLPFHLVRDSPFEWASWQDQDSGFAVPQEGAPERDDAEQRQQVSEVEGLLQLKQRMLRAVEKAGGRILKRLLQKRFWRARAKEFGRSLSVLIHDGILTMDGEWVVLVPRTGPEQHSVPRPAPGTVRTCQPPTTQG